jgi:hydrogenase maturation protease
MMQHVSLCWRHALASDRRIRIVVVGCGNHLASDDAVGLEVISQLKRVAGHICEAYDCRTVSPTFLSDLPPDTILIFVDAVRSGARPGTIHSFKLVAGEKTPVAVRSEIGLLLDRAKQVPQAYLIGIEIERWDPGLGISSTVHAAAVEVARKLAKLNGKGQPELPFFTDDLQSN